MAYNKFKKLAQLQDELGISEIHKAWLPKNTTIPTITNLLMVALQEAEQEGLMTEKAKSEYVVMPVLKELRRHNVDKFSTFSGYEFDVDKLLGLSGYCDFLLSAEITAPVFCLVEAKDAKIEKGFAQCGAEMYAAHIFNERKGNPKKQIFGCITNAFSWCFLKLENKNLYIDPNYIAFRYNLSQKTSFSDRVYRFGKL